MNDNITNAVISLLDDAVYVVKQKKLTKITPREFGKDTIIWKNGEVLDLERNEKIRFNGQEVI